MSSVAALGCDLSAIAVNATTTVTPVINVSARPRWRGQFPSQVMALALRLALCVSGFLSTLISVPTHWFYAHDTLGVGRPLSQTYPYLDAA